MKEWLLSHLPDLIPLLGGSGLLALRPVRAVIKSSWLAIRNRILLIKENLRLSDHLEMALDDATYWKESREDLDAKYDDLTQRFTEVRMQADAALQEIVQLKTAAERRKKLLLDFSADRDALLLWGRGLKEWVIRNGLPLPDTLTNEPVLATAAISQNILKPDTM